jgi:hypothetical protein
MKVRQAGKILLRKVYCINFLPYSYNSIVFELRNTVRFYLNPTYGLLSILETQFFLPKFQLTFAVKTSSFKQDLYH